MTYIRVVRPIQDELAQVPSQSVTWGNGLMDYIVEGTVDDVPADAVYAASLDDSGNYKTLVQCPAGFYFHSNFAGWIPYGQQGSTWPYPS